MKSRSGLAPYVLIGLGLLFLLSNLGYLPNLAALFHRWWPLILIGAGAILLIRR